MDDLAVRDGESKFVSESLAGLAVKEFVKASLVSFRWTTRAFNYGKSRRQGVVRKQVWFPSRWTPRASNSG